MQKTKTTIVRKEFSLSFASITYLDSERLDPHRSLRMEGISNRCNNEILRQQECDWPDEEM